MIEPNDKLIPIKIKTQNHSETYYLNESEYERNRFSYENNLDT